MSIESSKIPYSHTTIMSKFGVLVMGPAGAGKVCALPSSVSNAKLIE